MFLIDVCTDIYVMMSSYLYGTCSSADVIVMSCTNSNLLRGCNCNPYIGGSRGVCWHMPPLQKPILSFSHTFSLKSAHVGGQNPPKMGPHPPYGKSWIRPCHNIATVSADIVYSICNIFHTHDVVMGIRSVSPGALNTTR